MVVKIGVVYYRGMKGRNREINWNLPAFNDLFYGVSILIRMVD